MKKALNKFLYESILDSEFDGISIDQAMYKAAADLNKKLLNGWNHEGLDATGNKLNIGDVVICVPESWMIYKQKNKAPWTGGVNHINIGVIVDYKKEGKYINYIVRDPAEAFKYGIDPNNPQCHDQTVTPGHGIIKLDKKILVNLLK